MRDIYSILLRPLLTERSNTLKDSFNQYTFKVALDCNKAEVRRAVEELFKVEVQAVRTQIVPGKARRMGRYEGMRPDWKKAIVTLKKGQKIDITQET